MPENLSSEIVEEEEKFADMAKKILADRIVLTEVSNDRGTLRILCNWYIESYEIKWFEDRGYKLISIEARPITRSIDVFFRKVVKIDWDCE